MSEHSEEDDVQSNSDTNDEADEQHELPPPFDPDSDPTRPDWIRDEDLWKRFWEKVEVVEQDGETCYKWTGAALKGGIENMYGKCWIPEEYGDGGRTLLPHRMRVFYERPIPETKEVHHTCGNKWCVRLDHLQVVTHAENCKQVYADGLRDHVGSNNPVADLDEDDVRYLRRQFHLEGRPLVELAKELGINYTHASEILNEVRWGHVDAGIPDEEKRFRNRTELNPEKVRYLRITYHTTDTTLQEIADELGISPSHASKVLNGKFWGHIEVKIDEEKNGKAGRHNGRSELVEDDIRDILYRYYVEGETQVEIAKDYPVSDRQISKIVRRKAWSHVEVDFDLPDGIEDEPEDG